ncbi:MAG: DUF4382 domain-containing protein [Longimicrobiales bacterium]
MQHHFASINGKRVRTLALTALVAAAACDSSTGPETAHIKILLTDAPSTELDSALVWISRIYLQGGGGLEPDTIDADSLSSSGRVDLFNRPGTPLVFNLLKLRNGVTADLTAEQEVDVGLYQGLRLVVDSARVFLANGFTFENGSTWGTLKIPSGYTSGIKVKLGDVLRVEADRLLILTVDFDVDNNFKIIRNVPDGTVKQVIFTPVLREKARIDS